MKCDLLELYKRYNQFAFYHFNMMKRYDVDRLAKEGRLSVVEKEGKPVCVFETYTAKSRTKIKLFHDIGIGFIEKGDRVIRKFACLPDVTSDVLHSAPDPRWVTTFLFIWEEDETAKRVATEAGFKKIGIKIASTAEIEGVYCRGSDDRTVSLNPDNKVGIARLDLPAFDVSGIAKKLEQLRLDYKIHYSNYNVRNSWRAVSLKGYSKDPFMIEKPSSMPKKWQEENEGKDFELQDTELMKEFPEVLPILDAIHGEKNRVRFMYLRKEDGELGRHTDLVGKEAGVEEGQQMRIHVPIVTNPDVEFSVWNWEAVKENWNMRKGLAYYLDIRKPHAVVNGGNTDRVHLVIDVKSNKTLRGLVFQDGVGVSDPMVDKVMNVFKKYKGTLGHIRRDYVARQAEAGNIVYEDGVVIIFGKYQKRTRLGTEEAVAGDYILHQVANVNAGNGMATEVCRRFVNEVVGTADLWGCTRADNIGPIKLNKRLGMEEIGTIEWSGGKIKGLVFRRDGLYHSIVGDNNGKRIQSVSV